MSENIQSERSSITENKDIVDMLNLEGASNRASLTGLFEHEFQYSHMYKGKKFYKSKIAVIRKSGVRDVIPVIISQEVFDTIQYKVKGKYLQITGQINTHDVGMGTEKHRLSVFFCASKISGKTCEGESNNTIFLRGKLCSKIYVKTKLTSGKKVLDFFIGVKKGYRKRDNIPCIAWYQVADYIQENLKPGDEIELIGRIQSRKYFKADNEESDCENAKTTYEIAVSEVRLVSGNK